VRLITVAAAAEIISLNYYLFRLGVIWGIIGLTITKHVVVAWICMRADADRESRLDADGAGDEHDSMLQFRIK